MKKKSKGKWTKTLKKSVRMGKKGYKRASELGKTGYKVLKRDIKQERQVRKKKLMRRGIEKFMFGRVPGY